MRFFKIPLYMLAVVIVQTVIAPRLNFFGVFPDLVLVSVIVFSVLNERTPATVFSAAAGFVQDILSTGIYLNTIVKVLAANVVITLKEEFAGDEYSFAAGMVAAFTPVILLLEHLVFFFFLDRQFSLSALLFKMAAGTVYNLLMVPLLFPIIRGIAGGSQEE